MKALKTGLIALIMTSLTMPAFAGDLQTSAARAVEAQAAPAPPAMSGGTSKPMIMAGAALFVTGFTVGAYAFINNKNGKHTEFGEASARNIKLGSTGLGAAFAGGLIMFLGSRAKHAPRVSAGAGSLSVTKRLSW
jgi:hypothetical protein